MGGGNGRGMHGLPNPLGDGLFGDGAERHRLPVGPHDGGFAPERRGGGRRTCCSPTGPTTAPPLSAPRWWPGSSPGAPRSILAALAGWLYSRHLTKPILAMAGASNSMAKGDLAVRADVDRADEIGILAESFNAMADKNQATVTSLRRFVADAAHEIGTPLTALRSDIELARDGDDKAARERVLDRAIAQADRIGRLSGALLRLSLLDTGSRAR